MGCTWIWVLLTGGGDEIALGLGLELLFGGGNVDTTYLGPSDQVICSAHDELDDVHFRFVKVAQRVLLQHQHIQQIVLLDRCKVSTR